MTHSNMMFPGPGVGGYCLPKDGVVLAVRHRAYMDLTPDRFFVFFPQSCVQGCFGAAHEPGGSFACSGQYRRLMMGAWDVGLLRRGECFFKKITTT